MVWAQDDIMADEVQPRKQKQLFQELKKRFPEVPDNVVSVLMRDNQFIRERCIDALGRESNKYLDSQLQLSVELDAVRINETSERQHPSRAISNDDIHMKCSGLVDTTVGALSMQNHIPSNNISKSTTPNTTPNSDVDVLGMYHNPKYSGGQVSKTNQNGPFNRPYTHPSENQQSGWVYPPQPSEMYQSPSGNSELGGYPTHSQSGPPSIPPGVPFNPGYHHQASWGTYDPRHTSPPSTQRFAQDQSIINTRTPQSAQYQYNYSAPESPNTSRSPYYLRDLAPQFNPGTYMPPSSTTSSTTTPTSSPLPGHSIWYHGAPAHSEQLQSNNIMKLAHQSGSTIDARRSSEDFNYTQALLLHQSARMEKLSVDLQNAYPSLECLKDEVARLEKTALDKKHERSSTFPTGEDVGKIRDENRRLLIDIQLMTREIDVVNNGQTRLGVLDPEQNFHKNMTNTGQRGSIHAGGDNGASERGPEPAYNPAYNPAPQLPPARPPRPTFKPSTAVVPTVPPPNEPDDDVNWSCSACTFLNNPLMDRCELCEMLRIGTTGQGTQDYR